MSLRTVLTSPLRLGRGTLLFIGICIFLFVFGVAFRLNGSSSSFWYVRLHELDEAKGLIAGSPKPTRSDEWMVWTPAILAQLHHAPPMPVANESLGAGTSPLLMSVPVRHYSMFFRPQFWGFFLFDAERGFAWFWNAKVFGLLVSFFLFFLALMRGRVALAILSSLMLSYSSFIQWWFSSPSMLPELLTSWAVALLSGWIFFYPANLWKKLVAVVTCVAAMANFVFCCYPPFQIPLIYLALFLFSAFVWQRCQTSWHGGMFWLSGCLALTAALLWPTLVQCRGTLETIAHTSYPGARLVPGGGMAIGELLSGLLNFFDGEQQHADSFVNTSEAANFFPLWIPALFFVGQRIWQRNGKGETSDRTLAASDPLLIALTLFLIFFSLYALVGFPEWFCRVSLLGRCTEKRSLLAIGVAGLSLSLLVLRRDNTTLLSGRARIIGVVVFAIALLLFFLCSRSENPLFLSNDRFYLLFVTAVLVGAAYLGAKPVVFASILAAVLLLNNFFVNPVSQGLPSLIKSSAAQRIGALHKIDPAGTWAAYESSTLPQLLIASGARVLNGVKLVPDLGLLRGLDPDGDYRNIYNRYAYVVLRLPRSREEKVYFEEASTDAYRIFIWPTNPMLRAVGLKYVVFPRPLEETEFAGMQLVDAIPGSRIWIYKLN